MIGKLLGLANKATDIVDKVVEDKDAKNEFKYLMDKLKEEVYITELGTKTIPWVDALHKMGRQIISLITVLVFGFIIYSNPEVDLVKLLTAAGPAGLYTLIKGTGR